QVLMPRLASDIVPALMASRDGALAHFDLRWRPEAALTVVMATNGYPCSYGRGSEISGLDAINSGAAIVFHAGTKVANGKVLADGGRVLAVTALGKTVAQAQAKAYAAVDRIDWPGGFCRRDIGWRAVARERSEGSGR
ncbi:MAG: phosphoribosylamine--glycine ligase, partial [Alphaproteobacteria bacterium]|nr:phosphoribosylamine--glycine ligase [Alphaproteobacteria bacterium]